MEFLFCSFDDEAETIVQTIEKENRKLNQKLEADEDEGFTLVKSEEEAQVKIQSAYQIDSLENIGFHRSFNLPETEVLVQYYGCALVSTFPMQGWIYITRNFLCFSSHFVGSKKIVLPLKEITSIGKLGWFYSAIPLPKSIFIRTKQQDFVFAGFYSKRSEVLQTIQLCKNQANPSVSFRTNETVSSPMTDSQEVSLNYTGEKKRFTILIVGTRGDVQPFIALALGLKKVGHKVRFATHTAHQSFVEEYGLEFFPLAGDPKALIRLCVDNEVFSYRFIQEGLANFGKFIQELFQTCYDACKEDTDVIIQNPPAFAGVHIAEKLNIPVFYAFTMPWSRTTAFPHPFAVPPVPMGSTYNYTTYVAVEHGMYQPIRTTINEFREKLDLVPIEITAKGHSLVNDRRIPHIYCWSPSVLSKPEDWPEYINVCGYWFLDMPITWKPPEDLVKFLKKKPKPIYIGFGSVTVPDPDGFTRTIIAAVTKSGQRAVLVKGWGGLGNVAYPEDIYAIDSVPHDWLFPQLAGVIHHGGAGTTAAGLRSGCPTCIVPFFGDQFFWANRVVELGVGVPPLYVKTLTVDSMASAIKHLVEDIELQDKAKSLAEHIKSQDGVARALKFIDNYLGRLPKRELQESIGTPRKEGVIKKQGRFPNYAWKARFAKIMNKELHYFTDQTATQAVFRGKIPLAGASIIEMADVGEMKHCFLVKSTITRPILFSASSEDDRQQWINALEFASKGITFTDPIERMEGFLDKRGDNYFPKLFKRRYFINNGSRLLYYESKENVSASTPLGYIPLHCITEVERNPYYGSMAFQINTSEPKREWILRASTDEEMNNWMNFARKFLKKDANSNPEAKLQISQESIPFEMNE